MKNEKTIRERAIEYQDKRARQLEQLVSDITTLFYDYGLAVDEMETVFDMVLSTFEITEYIQTDDDNLEDDDLEDS